jgi:hypothetical protein
VERCAGADLPNRIAQRVDLCDQQVRPAVEQVRREEERSARNPIATMGGVCLALGRGGRRSAFPPYACCTKPPVLLIRIHARSMAISRPR